ncbi:hypothetical protein EVAR_25934_1, partial [Eumeta japonica]
MAHSVLFIRHFVSSFRAGRHVLACACVAQAVRKQISQIPVLSSPPAAGPLASVCAPPMLPPCAPATSRRLTPSIRCPSRSIRHRFDAVAVTFITSTDGVLIVFSSVKSFYGSRPRHHLRTAAVHASSGRLWMLRACCGPDKRRRRFIRPTFTEMVDYRCKNTTPSIQRDKQALLTRRKTFGIRNPRNFVLEVTRNYGYTWLRGTYFK